MSISRKRYWPYDEVSVSRDATLSTRFRVESPWLKFNFDIDAENAEKAGAIVAKLGTGDLTAGDLDDVDWFFAALKKYPLSYRLPRASGFGPDQHQSLKNLGLSSPQTLFKEVAQGMKAPDIATAWTWDLAAAIEFSKTPQGLDPEALFSVARRYHLLNDIEVNVTGPMMEFVASLKADAAKFREASAVVVRQNHYVTVECERTLSAALPIAQSAAGGIREFVEAESGHDEIILQALKALGKRPEDVPVLNATAALMRIFTEAASRNLLAFAMITDIFERSTYRSEDPMTQVLSEGGEAKAGRFLDAHREINDEGEHENVAEGFLEHMAPVDEAYAREALRLAELATLVVHRVSAETLEVIRKI